MIVEMDKKKNSFIVVGFFFLKKNYSYGPSCARAVLPGGSFLCCARAVLSSRAVPGPYTKH